MVCFLFREMNDKYSFLKRILDLNIDYGSILVDVVCIVGFVIKRLENYNPVFDRPLLNILVLLWYDDFLRIFGTLLDFDEFRVEKIRLNVFHFIHRYIHHFSNEKEGISRGKFSIKIFFRKAREIILTEFDGYACLEQDFLGDDQRIERFLRLVPDDNILFSYS